MSGTRAQVPLSVHSSNSKAGETGTTSGSQNTVTVCTATVLTSKLVVSVGQHDEKHICITHRAW